MRKIQTIGASIYDEDVYIDSIGSTKSSNTSVLSGILGQVGTSITNVVKDITPVLTERIKEEVDPQYGVVKDQQAKQAISTQNLKMFALVGAAILGAYLLVKRK